MSLLLMAEFAYPVPLARFAMLNIISVLPCRPVTFTRC